MSIFIIIYLFIFLLSCMRLLYSCFCCYFVHLFQYVIAKALWISTMEFRNPMTTKNDCAISKESNRNRTNHMHPFTSSFIFHIDSHLIRFLFSVCHASRSMKVIWFVWCNFIKFIWNGFYQIGIESCSIFFFYINW